MSVLELNPNQLPLVQLALGGKQVEHRKFSQPSSFEGWLFCLSRSAEQSSTWKGENAKGISLFGLRQYLLTTHLRSAAFDCCQVSEHLQPPSLAAFNSTWALL
jgi:hypothetical protein